VITPELLFGIAAHDNPPTTDAVTTAVTTATTTRDRNAAPMTCSFLALT
jgi:hypothetical protein